jgi:hypothetical protein
MDKKLAAAVLAATLVLASCASTQAQGKAPDWIFATPKSDASNTYFVGSSSDPTGDASAASNDAGANLIASITQYIGVKIDVNSTAEAKASLESYSASIRSTVNTTSKNQLAGFAIKERFVQTDKKTKRVTVYILASYVTADLEKEKARISKLFKEREDAVAKPEAEGAALESAGRAFEALRKYIEAAVVASGIDIDNADVKLQRNLNNARGALSRLRFDASASAGYSGFAGQEFSKPLVVRLVAGEGAAAPGVPGALVLLSYQRKSGTRLVSKTESVMTDATGGISFTPPAPDFVGKAKFTLKLDFQSSIDLLDKLPEKYAAYRDSLIDELRAKTFDLPYEVLSKARSASMAIAIVDIDESGAIVEGNKTQAGLVEALTREKFVVKGLSVSPDSLKAMDEAAAIAAAKAAGKFERVALGTAVVSELRKDGKNYLCSAKASVKVVEVASGNVIYNAERGITGFGSDEKSARAAAFRDLGLSSLGKDMLSSLP